MIPYYPTIVTGPTYPRESVKVRGRFRMSELVKLVECPRDAWQGLKGIIPADLKSDYLKALISAGFKHIDAVSFVSPKAVPQMSDSEEVLRELDPPDDVEIIGIVVNEKGAQRAIDTKAVSTLGFPYSISETFLRKNQNQSPEDALDELEKVQKKADDKGLDVVVYISMAFGNPYGDRWSADEVVDAIELLEAEDLHMISLADTVGMATAQQITELVGAVMNKYSYLEIGVHLHSRPELACRKSSGRVRCRLPSFRFGIGRAGRVSICAGCTGWKHPDRDCD